MAVVVEGRVVVAVVVLCVVETVLVVARTCGAVMQGKSQSTYLLTTRASLRITGFLLFLIADTRVADGAIARTVSITASARNGACRPQRPNAPVAVNDSRGRDDLGTGLRGAGLIPADESRVAVAGK